MKRKTKYAYGYGPFLKKETITRRLEEIGFEKTDTGMLLCRGQTVSSRIFLRFPDTSRSFNIVLDDSRWMKRSNVHIVSYWAWPHNLKELKEMIEGIRSTYTELCGSQFKT